MFGAIVGFIAPFLPEALKLGRQHLDHKHEMQMLELQRKIAETEGATRMQATAVHAQASDLSSARRAAKAEAVNIPDNCPLWVVCYVTLLAAHGNFFKAITRPGITWLAYGAYCAFKWQQIVLGGEFVWTELDTNILAGITAFWFGSRLVERAFGRTA